MNIPTTITSIDDYLYDYKYHLEQLTIPSTVKTIPYHCFSKLTRLTNITIPLNDTEMVFCNKIVNVKNLEEVYDLPNSIQVINGKDI